VQKAKCKREEPVLVAQTSVFEVRLFLAPNLKLVFSCRS